MPLATRPIRFTEARFLGGRKEAGRPGLASASGRTIRVCRAWKGILRLRVLVGSAAMARTKILAGPFGLKSVFFSSRNPDLIENSTITKKSTRRLQDL